MGDRAIVLFEDAGEIKPYGVYFHWAGGDGVEALYVAALEYMKGRTDDVSYFAARFVGLAHQDNDGKTGLGMIEGPTPEQIDGGMRDYSHGDAGVAIVTPETGAIRWVEGTGYMPRSEG